MGGTLAVVQICKLLKDRIPTNRPEQPAGETMTTDNLHMTITALDKASPVIDGLISKMKQLTTLASKISANPVKGMGSLNTGKSTRDDFMKAQNDAMKGLRQRFTMETKLNRQRVNEERTVSAEQSRTARIAESDVMRLFRTRMRATADVMRMAGVADREAERARARTIAADERQHAASIRRQVAGHRYLFGLRERMDREERRSTEQAAKSEDRRRDAARRSLGQGISHARDAGRGIMDTARTVTVYGGIAGGIAGKIAQTGLSARSRADTAEANARSFGNMSRAQVDQARSGWLNRAAVDNGFRPADAINAFTETLKAGIPEFAAPDVTKSIMGASAGLDLNVADTTKLVGRLSTLTQDPKAFSAGAIDSMLNSIAVTAKVTAADSKELVSSLRRGAGVLGSSKMSVGDLTAFTGTGISAGMQEGKAGTFMDFLVNDLVNAKNSRGQRRKDLASGLSIAGLGGVDQVSNQAANDPTKLLLKLFGNMAKMTPQKAGQVASLIGMREWRGEMLQMMKANPMLRQTVEAGRDPKNAGHLAQARDERLGTLAGLGSQLRATADLAWEAIGGGIEDIARDIGRFFVNLGGKLNLDVIQAHVASLLNGFVDGLGFANVTEMLERVFGSPDFSTVNSFFRFAQGFGQGVREAVDSIMGVVRAFTGNDASAETIGKLAAKIIGFAAALAIVSPFVGVIASIGAAFAGIGFAVAGFAKATKGLGLFGGTGAAGAAGGVLATAGGLIGVAFLAAIADKLGILKGPDVSKGWGRGILEFLDPGFASRFYGDGKAAPTDAQKAGPRKALDGAGKGVVRKQSLRGQDNPLAGLIQKASYVGYDDRSDATERLGDAVRTMGARFQLAALSGPNLASVPNVVSNSVRGMNRTGEWAGAANDPARSFGRNFFTPKGMGAPGWYGKASGSGSMPSVGAGVGPYRGILDHIAQSEGTAGRGDYNASLGYGRFLPSGKETNLTGRTLNEVLALGNHMRRQPGNPNSSALGRYQIVGTTLRGLMRKFGLNGSEKFDEAMQDRMGAELVRQRGASATGLGQEWASLRGAKLAKAVELAGHIGQSPAESVTNGLTGSIDGLRVKGAQATGGGAHAAGLTALARSIQDGGIAGGLNRFTAFNDHFHKGRRSKHNDGLASDFTLNDPSKSAQAAEQVRQRLRAAGLPDSAFKVIDEYRNPSGHATGGHIHAQFNGREMAERYRQFAERAKAGLQPKLATGEGGGWKTGAGGNAEALGMVPMSAADRAIGNVPMPPRRPAGLGGAGGGGGGDVHITQNIHGGQNTPQEIANLSQRQITKDWNHRSHDVEFDMA